MWLSNEVVVVVVLVQKFLKFNQRTMGTSLPAHIMSHDSCSLYFN